MSSEPDKVFDLLAGRLRKRKGLCPPTPEEAADAFQKADSLPLTEEEQAAIVEAMLAKKVPARKIERRTPRPPQVDQALDLECRSILRNGGEEDEETQRLEADIERRLLEEDDEPI